MSYEKYLKDPLRKQKCSNCNAIEDEINPSAVLVDKGSYWVTPTYENHCTVCNERWEGINLTKGEYENQMYDK